MTIRLKREIILKILFGLLIIVVLAIPSSHIIAASASLQWTAPGDDGNSGQATAYDIRFSLTPLSESSWSAAYRVTNPPLPTIAGTLQSTTVTSLLPSTNYYFGIKTRDEASNWSPLSNIILVTTNSDSLSTGSSAILMISPSNAGTIGNSSPFLTIQNDSPGPFFYYFEISIDPSFSTQVINSSPVDASSFTTISWEVPNQLALDQTYYWRVHTGDFLYGESWSFSVHPTTYPYPNPFRTAEVSSVTFTAIPDNSNLWIITVSGSPVYNWQNITGGELTWNGLNLSGEAVSSGLYIWYIEGSNIKGKLVLIR